MLENLLRYSHLGTFKQIDFVIKRLLQSPIVSKDLKQICLDSDYSFFQSFEGVIALFKYLEIINNENTLLKLNVKIPESNINIFILKKLFQNLSEDKQLHNLFSVKNIITYSNDIFIKLISLNYSSIRNLLMSLGFLTKDNLIINQFIITKLYLNFFKTEIIPLIEQSSIKNNSLENFHRIQKIKGLDGENAEQYVLKYEQSIRRNHQNFNNIKIISKFNVSAGYDVISYLSDDSIILDKFIEVKSYSEEQNFYWSSNEIQKAKEEKDNYFLYLIDKEKMNNKDFKPIIIPNPYEVIFQKNNKECQSWKFKIPIKF